MRHTQLITLQMTVTQKAKKAPFLLKKLANNCYGRGADQIARFAASIH